MSIRSARRAAQEIDRLTADQVDTTVILRLISDTALAFHRQAKFAIGSDGEVGITLDAPKAREHLRRAIHEEVGERTASLE